MSKLLKRYQIGIQLLLPLDRKSTGLSIGTLTFDLIEKIRIFHLDQTLNLGRIWVSYKK